jgi:hypothetical protein
MEERVEQFRDKLAEWRNTVLFKNLPNETHESAFTDGLTAAREVYYPQFIERLGEIIKDKNLTDSDIDTIYKTLGLIDTWTNKMLDQVRTILYSDLFEFPYTINTALIQQFKDEKIQPPQ